MSESAVAERRTGIVAGGESAGVTSAKKERQRGGSRSSM